MGKLSFTTYDFTAIKNPSKNIEHLRSIKDKMEDLAIILFKKYPDFIETVTQNVNAIRIKI